MKTKLRVMRIFWGVTAFLLVVLPGTAFAHENVGEDELAVANWMLIGAMAAAAVGGLFAVWAFRSGQFNNIEESKFTMLQTAEDYDLIMAESEKQIAEELAAEERAKEAAPVKPGVPAKPTEPTAATAQHATRI